MPQIPLLIMEHYETFFVFVLVFFLKMKYLKFCLNMTKCFLLSDEQLYLPKLHSIVINCVRFSTLFPLFNTH